VVGGGGTWRRPPEGWTMFQCLQNAHMNKGNDGDIPCIDLREYKSERVVTI